MPVFFRLRRWIACQQAPRERHVRQHAHAVLRPRAPGAHGPDPGRARSSRTRPGQRRNTPEENPMKQARLILSTFVVVGLALSHASLAQSSTPTAAPAPAQEQGPPAEESSDEAIRPLYKVT